MPSKQILFAKKQPKPIRVFADPQSPEFRDATRGHGEDPPAPKKKEENRPPIGGFAGAPGWRDSGPGVTRSEEIFMESQGGVPGATARTVEESEGKLPVLEGHRSCGVPACEWTGKEGNDYELHLTTAHNVDAQRKKWDKAMAVQKANRERAAQEQPPQEDGSFPMEMPE